MLIRRYSLLTHMNDCDSTRVAALIRFAGAALKKELAEDSRWRNARADGLDRIFENGCVKRKMPVQEGPRL